MAQETFTHDVVVHKANIALATGESIGRYTQALSEAGRKHVQQKLNMTQKGGYVFMVEAFSESAIFEVYKSGTNDTDSSTYKFFATTYKRKEGGFTFGELIEVERVTSFKPKSEFEIAKSKAKKDAADDLLDDVFEDENDDQNDADDEKDRPRRKTKKCSGWRRSTKNFWSGVL